MNCKFNSSSYINTLCTTLFDSLLLGSRKEICNLAAMVCSVIHEIFTSKDFYLILNFSQPHCEKTYCIQRINVIFHDILVTIW